MYTVVTGMDKSPVYICATIDLAKQYGRQVKELFLTFDDTLVTIRDYQGHVIATKQVSDGAWTMK